ncbi:MAG: hypothetical protein CBHOC_5384, partial [uncultured Caballeronia sp.]
MSDPARSKRHLRVMNDAARYRDRMRSGATETSATGLECGLGHAWNDSLDAAQNVRCMNCAAHRRALERRRLHEIAEVRGSVLLSSGYMNVSTRLSWQCAYGHVWEAQPVTGARSASGRCSPASANLPDYAPTDMRVYATPRRNRDRGRPHGPPPSTPRCVRVRTRRL